MRNSSKHLPMLTALMSSALLAACGGGAGADSAQSPIAAAPAQVTEAAAPAPIAAAPAEVAASPAPVAEAAPAVIAAETAPLDTLLAGVIVSNTVAQGAVVTNIGLDSTTSDAQTSVPVTFGQVFVPGHLLASESLVGKLADGTTVPLQLDVKAKHPDGSVRHAIISAVLPRAAAKQSQTMSLVKTGAAATVAPAAPDAIIAAGFSSGVNVTVNGQAYGVTAESLLKNAKRTAWLAGPIATEWLVSAPLTNAQGVAHPHLSARFAIRSYTGLNKAKVDVTIENDWAYEPNPQNFVYDAKITVGGKDVFTSTGMTHYHHARWRKTFWWGATPQINTRHNAGYLIATKAVPNYDQTAPVTETYLQGLVTTWSRSKTEPMGTGLAMAYMPTTGGRPDIGLMPGWAAAYLLSQDKRAKDVTLGTADLAGSWSAHYRDKNTDRPVSLFDYQYMTIYGRTGDTFNKTTQKYEAFPACVSDALCQQANAVDTSHQAGFAYLPYLVTGDYYYLEELQFYTMWNTFSSNPEYREYKKGLFKSDQPRGQAWSLRTLAEAAYITPDNDPFKAQFEFFLSSNLDWFNANYTNSADANKLGVIVNGYSLVDGDGTLLAPWMDDFFTSAVGHTAELGYANAKPLLAWKAKFPISRMVGADVCWITAGMYEMKLRDTATSPLYTSMTQVYSTNVNPLIKGLPCAGTAMAQALGLAVGEMTGYASDVTGYPANMQPALAYSVDSGAKNGAAAWSVFMRRSVKPNYGNGPQFNIVPR